MNVECITVFGVNLCACMHSTLSSVVLVWNEMNLDFIWCKFVRVHSTVNSVMFVVCLLWWNEMNLECIAVNLCIECFL